jgi:hypothetical protein
MKQRAASASDSTTLRRRPTLTLTVNPLTHSRKEIDMNKKLIKTIKINGTVYVLWKSVLDDYHFIGGAISATPFSPSFKSVGAAMDWALKQDERYTGICSFCDNDETKPEMIHCERCTPTDEGHCEACNQAVDKEKEQRLFEAGL